MANRERSAATPNGIASRFGQPGEHRFGVARHFDIAPALDQYAFRVDQEGAANNAHVVATVQLLLAEYPVGIAPDFINVRDQVERQRLLLDEARMRCRRIA